MRGILGTVFKLSYNEYWVTDNVFERMDFKKFRDMLTRSADKSDRIHSDEELKKILGYIHEHQQKYPAYLPSYALELQIAMGLRRGEIPPLRWEDIHDGHIAIKRELLTAKKSADNQKEYFRIVNHTKNNKNRLFPLTGTVKDILGRLKQCHQRNGLKSAYLFPAHNENGIITNNTVYGFYRRMCNKLGIPISRELIKGTHSFRRNAITRVVNNTGGDVILAAQLFGNSPEVAMKHYYTKADEEKALRALEM